MFLLLETITVSTPGSRFFTAGNCMLGVFHVKKNDIHILIIKLFFMHKKAASDFQRFIISK